MNLQYEVKALTLVLTHTHIYVYCIYIVHWFLDHLQFKFSSGVPHAMLYIVILIDPVQALQTSTTIMGGFYLYNCSITSERMKP